LIAICETRNLIFRGGFYLPLPNHRKTHGHWEEKECLLRTNEENPSPYLFEKKKGLVKWESGGLLREGKDYYNGEGSEICYLIRGGGLQRPLKSKNNSSVRLL